MSEPIADLSRSLDEAAALILSSSYVVVLAGAGLSVESGIPPFRGPGGLWTKYGEPTNLSYHEFTKDPKEWWEARFRNEDRPGDPTYELKVAVDQARLLELDHVHGRIQLRCGRTLDRQDLLE